MKSLFFTAAFALLTMLCLPHSAMATDLEDFIDGCKDADCIARGRAAYCVHEFATETPAQRADYNRCLKWAKATGKADDPDLITSFRGDWCRDGKYSNKLNTYEPCIGKQKPDIRFWADGSGYSTKTRRCKILSTKLTGGPESEQIVQVRCTDRQGVTKNITAGFGHICDRGCIGFHDLKDKELR
jgi:hypothetical protein